MKNVWLTRALQRVEGEYLARMGLSLPLASIALVIIADLIAGRDHFLTPGIVVAPPLAAITVTWRKTLFIGVFGLFVQAALAPYDGITDIPDHDVFFGQAFAYALVTLFSVYIAWRRETGARAFTAIASVAEAAQHALMRPPDPRVGSVRLAVRYVSAADAAQIGGDLYAVIDTPHGVRALIGDVRGKGLAAVQTSAVVLGAFREAAFDEGGLDTVARRVDTSVGRHVTTGDFITALFAQFDEPGSVELLHYGHVAPLRVSRDGAVETLDPAEPWVPLGLADLVSGGPTAWRVPMLPGDVLVLCTDGVIEARSPLDNTFYPLGERVGPLVAGAGRDLDAAVERVYEDLLRHAGGSLSDDVVLLLLSPQPEALPAHPQDPPLLGDAI
ncbi:PP2C family protein-serine/threonine phosphatase [Actinacidiphila bryophytorum]|uniref:Stage II sporulation protein E (SpoIIE) n=2 Tax=Actinacidiphila bryophytorum TaxID=1436133 RepID=A0A9W4E5D1_9ACTN|nr:PP2C family protein-serine/threonine phosphatase [Actinacidiphila bryophytorum]CAG7624841.1 Stage II sporulation protein E (SpoIIE) [Actinacidiphila bryophytorum]